MIRDEKKFPEDMSISGVLTIYGFRESCKSYDYSSMSIEVKPSKDSMTGVIEFCNSGTRYRDRKIHNLLKRIKELLTKESSQEDDCGRLKIKVGDDGDIRVFITEKVTDKLVLDLGKLQTITFENGSPVFNLLCAYFNNPEIDTLSYRFV